MLVFWKAGLVLLAVPKTGTQAYEALLAPQADVSMRHPPALKHMTAQKFRRQFLPMLGDNAPKLQTVAVIREPLDWLGSWYRYRSRSQLDGHPNSTAGVSFEAFVEAYLQASPPEFARVGAQARFVSNGQGKVLVDHLFAFERPLGLRAFLSERLDREIPAPAPTNVSPRKELTLPDALKARLQAERAADFALHASLM